jgi:hypothetical protein
VVDTVQAVIEKGGRYDEVDLYDNRADISALWIANPQADPARLQEQHRKMQYLGGSCYYCPNCQD